MSSFTHYLEEEILNQHIKVDGLYIGLSRENGNRRGTFAVWGQEEGDYVITEEGIDEPGEGWFYDSEDEQWKEESAEGLADSYSRQAIGSIDWHDVDVVLGEDGDSELRLSEDVVFATLTEGEDWGNITHFFIADGGTTGAGNILAWGSMPDSVQLVEGMEAKIWANTIVVRMTD